MSVATGSAADGFLPPWLGDIDLLLDELRHKQFSIGVGEHTKVVMLLDHLMKQQETISDARELMKWLSPVVCNTPAQKQQLESILLEREARYDIDLDTMIAPEPTGVPAAAPTESSKTPSVKFIVIGILALAIGVMIAINVWPDLFTTDTVIFNPEKPKQPLAEETSFSLFEYISFSWPEFSKEYVLQLLLAFGFISWSIWRIYRLRNKTLKLARQVSDQQLSEKPIRYHLDFANLFSGTDLSHPIQILRKHIDVNSHQLDIDKTLDATIKSGGKIIIKEGTRPQLPEYVLLSRKSSSEDHHGTLSENLAQRLQKEQIFVKRLEYILDPRRCRDQKGNVVNLADMQGGQLHQRLLLIDDAEAFFVHGSYHTKPWFDLIQRWNWVAILTPKPCQEWGKYEMLLVEMGVHLQPISPSGISTLARQLQEESEPTSIRAGHEASQLWSFLENEPYRWTQSHVPEDNNIETLVRLLEEDLPKSAFELLSCLSVLPVLTPNLTLYLAQALRGTEEQTSEETSLEEVFGYLSRLPWFKEGYMPDWLRTQLIGKIPYQLSGRVRSICQSMIANDLSSKDANFVLKIADKDKFQWQRLLKGIYKYGDDTEWHDYIFLGFLDGNNNLQLDIEQKSQLGKSKRPAISGKEIRYALYGLIPALLLLPHSEIMASLMSLLFEPLEIGFEVLAINEELVSYLFASSTFGCLLLTLISFNLNSPRTSSVARWLSLLPFLIALTDLFLIEVYGKSEDIYVLDALVVSALLCSFVWLRPGEKIKSSVLNVDFKAPYWGRAFAFASVALFLYIFNVHDVEDIYYGPLFSKEDLADEPLHYIFLITTIVISTICIWRYLFAYSLSTASSIYRIWRSFLSVFVYFVSFYAGWIALQIVIEDSMLFVGMGAQAIAIVITANYFSRFCHRDQQLAFVQSLNRTLVPWLLMSYVLTWLAWGPFSDILGFDSEPRAMLGVGVFLWLAAAVSVRQTHPDNDAMLLPYTKWGGTVILLSSIIVVAISSLDVEPVFYSTDFWSMVLLLPVARFMMPWVFKGPAKKAAPIGTPKSYWLLLPLLNIFPAILVSLVLLEDLYMPTIYPGLCLVPYGIWLVGKYGRNAHWSFVLGYFVCASAMIPDTFMEEVGGDTYKASGFLMYLFLANFVIYLSTKVRSWHDVISINSATKSQWLFLLLVLGVSSELIVTDSFALWWDGPLMILPVLLMLSVSNLSFNWPVIVACIVASVGFLSNLFVKSSGVDSLFFINLTPNGLSDLTLVLSCLLGFRICMKYALGSKWLTPILFLLLSFQLVNLELNLTETVGMDLSNPYIVIALCLLCGVFQSHKLIRFILSVLMYSVVFSIALLAMSMNEGFTFGLQWRTDITASIGLLICCGIFYHLGTKARSVVGQKQMHLDQLLQTEKNIYKKQTVAMVSSPSLGIVRSTLSNADYKKVGWPVLQSSRLKVAILGLVIPIWATWFTYHITDEFDDIEDFYDEVMTAQEISSMPGRAAQQRLPQQTYEEFQQRPYQDIRQQQEYANGVVEEKPATIEMSSEEAKRLKEIEYLRRSKEVRSKK